MSKKKKANKKIRNMHGSVTLKELEDSGQVPKDFHLFDIVDMKEWQAKQPGYKEWEQGLKEQDDFEGPNPNMGI
tara:strand:+ start:1834 stop:2055 length:222 start_codon:yes stop_codon:yes gene_type:complete